MTPVITVVIADDHPIFRMGLRQILDTDAALRVVAEAGDGDEALAAIASAQPDLAVLDIDMPDATVSPCRARCATSARPRASSS